MIGILFIVIVTWVIVFVLHLASEGKIKFLDEINDGRLANAVQKDVKAINTARKEWIKREKFLARQIVRRNPGRRKGEIRKKKTKVIGFRE